MIAKQLQKEQYRFVKLKAKDKKPFENDWQNTKNYTYNDQSLQEHIRNGGNYGVIGGFGNVRIIDCDNKEFAEDMISKLDTFTVRTGSGGCHLYVLSDYDTNHVFTERRGEYRANANQVVGAGSTHPNGNKYEIIKDKALKEITSEEIKKLLEPYLTKKSVSVNETDVSSPLTINCITEMLDAIPADDYHIWIRVIGALKHESEKYNLKNLRNTADKWSSKSEKYKGSESVMELWNSLNKTNNPCTMGTIIYLAREYGWKGKLQYDKDFYQIRRPSKGITQSKFIKDVVKLLKNNSNITLFYRIIDDRIVIFQNHKLKPVTPASFVTIVDTIGSPGTYVKIKKETENEVREEWVWKEQSIDQNMAKIAIESSYLKENLPLIDKVLSVPIPILKDEKLIIPKPGYNPELKLYVDPSSPEIIDVPFVEATNSIITIYKDFCYKTELDLFKAIMSYITPAIRGLYTKWNTRSAIFIFFANRERAGKDYLAGIRSITFTGTASEYPPINTGGDSSNSNEELRKKILSALLEGGIFYHSSNNKGYINNSVFEMATTAPVIKDRILGKTENISVPNILEYSLSGNIGTTITPDLANRSIPVNLSLNIENINARTFSNPYLHETISSNRGYYLGCIFSIIKNWHSIGMPKSEVRFTSFPEWAALIGGIIESVPGWKNPLTDAYKNSSQLDKEMENMLELFQIGKESYENKELTKSEIKSIAISNELFSFMNLEERSGATKFGLMIDKFVNRELSGITLKVLDENVRSSRRKFIFSDSQAEVFDASKYLSDNTGGNLGNFGNLSIPPTFSNTNKKNIEYRESLPSLPRLPSSEPQNLEINRNDVFEVLKWRQGLAKGKPISTSEIMSFYHIKTAKDWKGDSKPIEPIDVVHSKLSEMKVKGDVLENPNDHWSVIE